MLGLRDEVGGEIVRIGTVIGEDADLGRAGLGIDADDTAQQPLGRRDIDVAGTGHEIDPGHAFDAVGEHRHRLRPTDRIDLRRPRAARRRPAPRGSVRPPNSAFGGDATASEATPATWAGTTFITTLDG